MNNLIDGLYQGGVNSFEKKVYCPICGSESVHIAKVLVNQDGHVTDVTKGRVEEREVHSNKRGSVVKILFWCEEGSPNHYFTKVLEFYKGETFEEIQVLDIDHELWRD